MTNGRLSRGAPALLVALLAAPASVAEEALRTALPEPVSDADYQNGGNPPPARVELGRLLFFDKILSGNRNISCATCHRPELGTGDSLALTLGEGARGLGRDRRAGSRKEEAVHARMPRNSQPLFNLGAREFTALTHDGQIQTDPEGFYDGGFITPAKWKLPTGLDTVLAAQAMFPPTSPVAMAGQKGENPIANARSLNNAAGPGGVWEQLGQRLQEIPGYVELFERAFPERVKRAEDITYVLAANAIAAFEGKAFRADDSPFDRYLRGDDDSLTVAAKRGATLFYGEAGCSRCHAGKFLTDHDFHAIAMPQIGPGKADGSDGEYWRSAGLKAFVEDFGRGRVTFEKEDRYSFRTPTLRNVALTGPWGHAGAYDSLEGVVRHHLAPVESLNRYALAEGTLPPLDRVLEVTAVGSALGHSWLSESRLQGFLARDGWVQGSPRLRGLIAEANELEPIDLSNQQVADLLAFLEALTDPGSLELSELVPDRVPSGLPVAD